MKILHFVLEWDLLKVRTIKLLLCVALGSIVNSECLWTTVGSCWISVIGSVGGDCHLDFAHSTKKIKYGLWIKLL